MVAKQAKRTRFAKSVREGSDHISNYFETGDLSQLTFALEAFKDAEAQADSPKQVFFCKRMRTLIRLLT